MHITLTHIINKHTAHRQMAACVPAVIHELLLRIVALLESEHFETNLERRKSRG